MTNYTWTISSMETAPSEDGLTDVVKTIHWRYKGVDGDYQAEVYSSFACASPSSTDFTAYEDLTEADVIGWLEAGIDVDAMNTNIDSQIENLKNPPIVSLPLPWENNQ
jgi:hypothetical protein